MLLPFSLSTEMVVLAVLLAYPTSSGHIGRHWAVPCILLVTCRTFSLEATFINWCTGGEPEAPLIYLFLFDQFIDTNFSTNVVSQGWQMMQNKTSDAV